MGNVTMHKDLLSAGETCIGGGMYQWDYTANRLLLEGKSYDYGRVKWSWIDRLILPSSLDGVSIYYEDLPLSDFVTLAYTR